MLKFKKSKVSALTGQTEVRFTETSEETFAVISDAGGIRFQGLSPVISDRKSLDELAKTIGAAWNEHVTLRQALRAKLSNH